MLLREPEAIVVPEDAAALEAALAALPQSPAVFLAWPRAGQPYLARTTVLRRRLTRLLGERSSPSRWLSLRAVASRIDYWLTGSSLEQSLVQYELARRHFPEDYLERIRLRMPAYVKLILSNEFPRTQITTRMGGGANLYFGPFPARAAAEQFDSQFLNLFHIRRCQEDLIPSPEHPGCIYGEMSMCLRPCQQAVTTEEYASETARVRQFLETSGESLLESVAVARDRLSEEMDFEQAARQHQRHEQIREVVRSGGELAREITRLHGVAVTPSSAPDAVELWFVRDGCWRPPVRLSLAAAAESVSLDRRLREVVGGLAPLQVRVRVRQEHLALLVRWFYSSWRDGEWLGFDSLESVPYRKLVNAIHRVARHGCPSITADGANSAPQ